VLQADGNDPTKAATEPEGNGDVARAHGRSSRLGAPPSHHHATRQRCSGHGQQLGGLGIGFRPVSDDERRAQRVSTEHNEALADARERLTVEREPGLCDVFGQASPLGPARGSRVNPTRSRGGPARFFRDAERVS